MEDDLDLSSTKLMTARDRNEPMRVGMLSKEAGPVSTMKNFREAVQIDFFKKDG